MKKRIRWYNGILVFIIIFIGGGFSLATDFPTKPIEWFAVWGAGSHSALALKVVLDIASKDLGKPFVMIPVTGGTGTIGTYRAARAKPDGYTLFLAGSANNIVALHIMKEIGYSIDDFEFLASFGTFELGLVVSANAPYKRLEDFVEYAKKNPSAIKVGTHGVGSSPHLLLEQMNLKTGAKVDMVTFKTTYDLRTAILGAHVPAVITFGGNGRPTDEFNLLQKSGAKVLAVGSKTRLKAHPNIPTFAEVLAADMVYWPFYGIAAPKGMPKEVSEKLKNAIYKALEKPESIDAIENVGLRYEFLKSEEFTKRVKEFDKLIKKVVEEAKIPRI